MCQPIMVGCDLHDKTMLLKIAQGAAPSQTVSVRNTVGGRVQMIGRLLAQAKAAGGAQVIFAYEASGLGFGLHDELTDAGIECHVLAPTLISRSQQQKRRKTDEYDAEILLEKLSGYVLAGHKLPSVWIPDHQTRDDREVVRARIDAAEKLTGLKTQVQSLLKRYGLRRPCDLGAGWSKLFRTWLNVLTTDTTLRPGFKTNLGSLLRQLIFQEEEIVRLDAEVERLATDPRYAPPVAELLKIKGVGQLTALVFLTEIGNLNRFQNRRQIAAYLGLAPSSNESGERNDRKGHITRQGPSRVRRLLCQAAWTRIRCDQGEHEIYGRLVKRNPKKKKIAVVATMRRLAVRMWHAGRAASGPPQPGDPPRGRARPASAA